MKHANLIIAAFGGKIEARPNEAGRAPIHAAHQWRGLTPSAKR